MSDFTYAKHAHEEYSIGLTLQGRQDFFCRNAFYKSTPGNILLFNPEDMIWSFRCRADSEYVMLYPPEGPTHFSGVGTQKHTTLRLNDTLIDDPMLRQQIYVCRSDCHNYFKH